MSSSLLRITGKTKVVGVIGWPVEHSLSPPMHNAAFEHLGLDWVYVAFPVPPERAHDAIRALPALGIVGINVTIPHKRAAAEAADELDDSARDLQAANTIVRRGDVLVGYNTDGPGFLRSLAEVGEKPVGKQIALIGAGGAAKAVAFALARAGASEVTIINRTLEKAVALAAELRAKTGCTTTALPLSDAAASAVSGADIVINCTPVGMHPNTDVPPVVSPDWLHEGQLVCDLIYNPRDTVLLRAARQRGARTLDGSGMLVHQGAIAFELWTGQRAPVEVMRRALLQALGAAS